VDYVKTHYKAPRIVLAAAGGVNHNELVKLAEKHLSGVKSTYEGEIPILEHCRFTGQSLDGIRRFMVAPFPLDTVACQEQWYSACSIHDPL
jgi:predicted Zn-dependent peptidase